MIAKCLMARKVRVGQSGGGGGCQSYRLVSRDYVPLRDLGIGTRIRVAVPRRYRMSGQPGPKPQQISLGVGYGDGKVEVR